MNLKDPSSLRTGATCTGSCAHPQSKRCRLELPTRSYSPNGKENLERMGFVHIADSTIDAIYAVTDLPEGWTHGPTVEDGLGLGWTGHSIYDDKKRVRVHSREHEDYTAIRDNIFPELVIVSRYAMKNGKFPSMDRSVVDNATGKLLFTTAGLLMIPSWESCRTWLDQNFPDWRNSSAYWD